jgi:hypothetical protein
VIIVSSPTTVLPFQPATMSTWLHCRRLYETAGQQYLYWTAPASAGKSALLS